MDAKIIKHAGSLGDCQSRFPKSWRQAKNCPLVLSADVIGLWGNGKLIQVSGEIGDALH
jgi:hypothetical protein